MSRSCFVLLLVSLAGVALCGQLQEPIWPAPKAVTFGSQKSILDFSRFKISTNSSSPILRSAVERYYGLIFPVKSAASGDMVTLVVDVRSDDETLQLGIDESYVLDVDSRGGHITANGVYGALRGLETFSQLVRFDLSGKFFYMTSLPIRVDDAPRFPWRGMLVDTSRHFLPLNFLMGIVDQLAYNKMNTFHWHVVDAQSFPFVSVPYPDLSGKGAYLSPLVYSPSDVAKLIEYGKFRGVRVVPEFDIPGHAYSWGLGYPWITAKCPSYSKNVNNIPLDPTNPATYEFLKAFLEDALGRFPDAYFHMGGDEVVYGCWQEDPSISKFMKDRGWTGSDLYRYFHSNLLAVLSSITKKGVRTAAWQEVWELGVVEKGEPILIHVWKDATQLHSVVAAGYQAILSGGWYLDKQLPSKTQTHYEFEDTWIDFYNNEPITSSFTPAEAERVLGGEACMWAEQVDQANWESRVWPRASAVAEKLWSPSSYTAYADALPRLNLHSCRMANRGVRSGPIAPGLCARIKELV